MKPKQFKCLRCSVAVFFLFSCAAGAALPEGTPVVLIDQNGREVKIPAKVERVATLVIPAASMVLALDQGAGRLVGIHPASRAEIVDGMLGRFFPESKKIRADVAGEGFAPNVEALLASKADLVVQWGDRGDAALSPIVKVGLPVLTLNSAGGGEIAAEWLRILGRGLTGREARGEALAEAFLATKGEIAKSVAQIPESRRPRVVYLYRRQGNAFQVAGGKTTVDSDIRLAGGINPASHLTAYASVSAEQVLAWAPDIVLLGNFDKDLKPALLFESALFASVPAVKDKRVYLYPRGGFRWDPPSQETPLAWRWLFALFHPDAPSAPLRGEIVETYRRLYGHTLNASEIGIIMRMIDNNDSLNYSKKFSH
ncbi:MAG: ABC transporter substrate-binding protein [Candidatus Accumulibacter sp.]|jgi:iron complex transport system substrate-binding protein|nr:ABC transporter substrate-binding protein [Accumulibacter sp.]